LGSASWFSAVSLLLLAMSRAVPKPWTVVGDDDNNAVGGGAVAADGDPVARWMKAW